MTERHFWHKHAVLDRAVEPLAARGRARLELVAEREKIRLRNARRDDGPDGAERDALLGDCGGRHRRGYAKQEMSFETAGHPYGAREQGVVGRGQLCLVGGGLSSGVSQRLAAWWPTACLRPSSDGLGGSRAFRKVPQSKYVLATSIGLDRGRPQDDSREP